MDWWWYLVIVLAGMACGFVNVLAGSGSLITLPLLIFLGIPANVANGTNRVAILAQNLFAVSSYHRRGLLDFQRGRWLALPALLGGILGAMLAVDINERQMRLIIGLLMAAMFFVILLKPDRWLREKSLVVTTQPKWIEWVIFFVVGVYGGFIQAGVGLFLLAGLVLASGYDLVKANGVKLLLVLAFTSVALVVFIFHGQVAWGVGLVLALGNSLGALLGTRAAFRGGARFVRWVLLFVVAASACKLFWDSLVLP